MPGFFSSLLKGAVAGRTGHLQGQRLGEEDVRQREADEGEQKRQIRRLMLEEAFKEHQMKQPRAPVRGSPEYLDALTAEEGVKDDAEIARRKKLRDAGLLWEPNAGRGGARERDPLTPHVNKRTVEMQEPRRGQYSGDPEIPGLPMEEAHGKAIDEAVALGMQIPQEWLEHAAQDPEYAAHLKQHGIDPVTGRMAFRGVIGGSSTTAPSVQPQ